MTKRLRKIISSTMIFSILSASSLPTFSATEEVNSSGGENCFRTLDALDIENLSNIINVQEDITSSPSPINDQQIELQKKMIDKSFSGKKKEAAYAMLSFTIAEANKAALKRVMNKVIARGNTTLGESDKKEIVGLINQAKKENIDLEEKINLKLPKLFVAAEKIKSRGASLSASGEWIFDEKFNFDEANSDPDLKSSLEAYFPEQINELSLPGRGFTRIGNRVVMTLPDPTQKASARPKKWIWKSANLEEHTKKTLGILDQIYKKSEEYARMAQENGHWLKIMKAAMDKSIIGTCGLSYTDILTAPILGLALYFTHTDESKWNEWSQKLAAQEKIHKEIEELRGDLLKHGTSTETYQEIGKTLEKLLSKSADEMEEGLIGMRRGFSTIAFAPLAVISAPIAAGGAIAGATTVSGTVLAVAGTLVTATSVLTSVATASSNIYKGIKNGDGKLCSVFKYGTKAPVEIIENLKWASIGPVFKGLAPAITPVGKLFSNHLKLSSMGVTGKKIAIFLPGLVLSGWGLKSGYSAKRTNQEVINNIEEALKEAKSINDKKRVLVLEEILSNAKQDRWNIVLGLAGTYVALVSEVKSVATKDAIFKYNDNGPKTDEFKLGTGSDNSISVAKVSAKALIKISDHLPVSDNLSDLNNSSLANLQSEKAQIDAKENAIIIKNRNSFYSEYRKYLDSLILAHPENEKMINSMLIPYDPLVPSKDWKKQFQMETKKIMDKPASNP